jgi:hypothetical protein
MMSKKGADHTALFFYASCPISYFASGCRQKRKLPAITLASQQLFSLRLAAGFIVPVAG